MFNNLGHKIKTVAKIFTWVGIISCVLYGLIIIFSGGKVNVNGMSFGYAASIPVGLAIMIIGSVCSWLVNLTLYGFGELVENSSYNSNSSHPPKKTDDGCFLW